jgi:hypothetical protein
MPNGWSSGNCTSQYSYTLLNAPADTPVERVAELSARRYFVERTFQDAKSELGWGEFSARRYRAWEHHLALTAAALWFVAQTKLEWEEGGGGRDAEIEGLLAELADQRRILSQHQQRLIDAQHERNEQLAGRLQRVKERLARQECLNHQLKRRVAELEAAQVTRDSHNSSLPPSLDPPAVKAANSVRRTRSLRRPSGKLPGAQPGHTGHTRPCVEQPDQVMTHSPAQCRGCGASLSGGYLVKSESRQVIDLPPVKPWVVEHRALTKRCRSCDEVTKGRFPKGVRAAVQYGVGCEPAPST